MPVLLPSIVSDCQTFFSFLTCFIRIVWRVRDIIVRLIMNYTTGEYADMIICYGMTGENALAAEHLYAERFPNRRHPSHVTIARCVRRLRETGFVLPQHQNRVDVPVRRHVNDDEEVLRAFEDNPGNSVRRVAHALDIPRSTVHRILRENGLHPYHYQRVQQLLERDQRPRVHFCAGILYFLFRYSQRFYNTIIALLRHRRIFRTMSAKHFISRPYFVDR